MLNLRAKLMAGALAALLATGAHAEDLRAGTTIQASNLDQLLDQTFEGKTIRSMLTERLKWQIRDHGLRIQLANSEPWPRDPDHDRLTQEHAGMARFNPDTRMIENYCTGTPFTDISVNDPHAGWKLMWNFHFGQLIGGSQNFSRFAFLLIDGRSGLERTQHWWYQRYFETGRTASPFSCGSDGVLHRTLLFATFPRDISGLGTLTVRFNDGRPDNIWAYLPAVRRVRTLSGGAWMDPIGGTDQLQDDIEVFNAHPTWYQDFRVIDRRWVLAVANARSPTWNEGARDVNAQHPRVDLGNAPHWNVVDQWEPREVWVIEGIPPDEHPYSRRVMYMDVDYPRLYFAEAYDRAGDFWKFLNFASQPMQTEQGGWSLVSAWGQVIDFKRQRATIFQSHPSWETGSVQRDDVSVNVLQRGGR